MPVGSQKGLRRIALLAAAAILIGGLFAIAYLHANGVASCLNKSLGSRNPIVAEADAAQKRFAHAQSTFGLAQKAWAAAQRADADALQKVLTLRAGSAAQTQAFGGFIVEHKSYNVAAGVFATAAVTFADEAVRQAAAIDAVQKARIAHPLGGC